MSDVRPRRWPRPRRDDASPVIGFLRLLERTARSYRAHILARKWQMRLHRSARHEPQFHLCRSQRSDRLDCQTLRIRMHQERRAGGRDCAMCRAVPRSAGGRHAARTPNRPADPGLQRAARRTGRSPHLAAIDSQGHLLSDPRRMQTRGRSLSKYTTPSWAERRRVISGT